MLLRRFLDLIMISLSQTKIRSQDVTEEVKYMKTLFAKDHFCCSFSMLIKVIFLMWIVLWDSAVQDGLAQPGDEGKVIGNPHK